MKKKVVVILGIIAIIIVVLLVIFLGDKNLDLTSDNVKKLYSYLGEVDIYHCGGLNQYSGEEVGYTTISNENKMCMAYFELDDEDLKKETSNVTATNDNDLKVCEIGEGIRLVSSNDKECNYEIVSKEALENSYKNIYGNKLPDENEFYINSNTACYLKDNNYYCGEAETFIYSLTPESTIYRLLNSAKEKMNGNIVISDYYLRVSDNKCYQSNNNDSEITSCSKQLAENPDLEINSEFVSKYGAIYEHTFNYDNNTDNYYWSSSNLK